MRKLDYHAKLIVYNLPALDKETLQGIQEWLEMHAKTLKNQPKDYSKTFTAKYMK